MLKEEKASLLLEHLQDLKAQGLRSISLDYDAFSEFINSFKSESSSTLPETSVSFLPPVAPKQEVKKEKLPEPKLTPPAFSLPQGDKQVQWDYLKNLVLNDEECKRNLKTGKKLVFGVGNLNADIFFCGEAPGADEEIEGEPFVGKAGQLLTKIIQAMGLSRSDVYIANIMNWRPEMPTDVGNRPPTQDEMHYCLPFLQSQINIVQPKVIVALGATAVNGLLGKDPKRRMTDVRGTWSSFNNIPLMITFHPSYLLRNQSLQTKRTVWEDMLKVMERVGLVISQKQRGYFMLS